MKTKNRFQEDGCLKEKVRHPKMYAVIYLNDHITTADFVIDSLMEIFNKDRRTAEKLTVEVDSLGQCIAGIYSKNIAETKKNEVLAMAKARKMPFQVITEPVDDEEEE